MKKYILFIFFVTTNVSYSQIKSIAIPSDSAMDTIPPEFAYAKAELDSFIYNNLINPPEAEYWGINAKVKVFFNVDSLSSVSNIKILKTEILVNSLTEIKDGVTSKDLSKEFNEEVIRLVNLMNGLWNPAKVKNEFICQPVIILIKFKTKLYDKKNEEELTKRFEKHYNYQFTISDYSKLTKPKQFYDLGVKKLAQQKYSIAAKYFEEAIRFNPKDIDAFYNLGISKFKTNDISSACNSWLKAQQLGDREVSSLLGKYCIDIIPTESKTKFNDISNKTQEEIFTVVEKMPKFKGGDIEQINFIQQNCIYPFLIKDAPTWGTKFGTILGTVYITCVVNKDGKLNEIKVLNGIIGEPGLEAEALRIVQSMPNWNPGSQNEKEVNVQITIPISFVINFK